MTESLKKNIPASGLHLFGINQLEEDDMTTSKLKDFCFIFKIHVYRLFLLWSTCSSSFLDRLSEKVLNLSQVAKFKMPIEGGFHMVV